MRIHRLTAAGLLASACAASPHHEPTPDARVTVDFPAEMRDHTLANMRDHLVTLQRIQGDLAAGRYDSASHLAESRLGLTSLEAHGAHDLSRYMPEGMQAAGTAMHRAASRFAIAAADAGATGDVRAALAALSEVTANCVACHAGYRLR